MENGFTLIVLALVFFVAIFILPQWRIRRAIRQVVKIFLEHGATRPSSAETSQQLGFAPDRGVLMSLFSKKDYKKYALDALLKAGTVQRVEDGRLYLSEERVLQLKL